MQLYDASNFDFEPEDVDWSPEKIKHFRRNLESIKFLDFTPIVIEVDGKQVVCTVPVTNMKKYVSEEYVSLYAATDNKEIREHYIRNYLACFAEFTKENDKKRLAEMFVKEMSHFMTRVRILEDVSPDTQ